MLVVLGLIDVVMISNLLIMVIVGGYETFVSRMHLEGHPDQPEWLSHVNASRAQGQARHRDHRHLVDPPAEDLHQRAGIRREGADLRRPSIHVTFLLSALAIAAVDRIMPQPVARARQHADDARALTGAIAMTTIRQDDFIQSVADALQYISYYHPLDYIDGARRGVRAPSSRRRRRTRSRRSSPTRGCAPKATGRSARTPASSSRS